MTSGRSSEICAEVHPLLRGWRPSGHHPRGTARPGRTPPAADCPQLEVATTATGAVAPRRGIDTATTVAAASAPAQIHAAAS